MEFISNTEKVLRELNRKSELACELIGEVAQGYAMEDTPVDTGRLRNSITYAVRNKQGDANTNPGENADPHEYVELAEPEEKTVYIGTNVEYAQFVELRDSASHTSGKAHFLRDSIAKHGKQYKSIAETVLKS